MCLTFVAYLACVAHTNSSMSCQYGGRNFGKTSTYVDCWVEVSIQLSWISLLYEAGWHGRGTAAGEVLCQLRRL